MNPIFRIKYETQALTALTVALENALLFDAMAKASSKLHEGAELVETAGEYSFPTRHFGGDTTRLDELNVKVEVRLVKQPWRTTSPFANALWDIVRRLTDSIIMEHGRLKNGRQTVEITTQPFDTGDLRSCDGDIEIESNNAIYKLYAKATVRLDTCKTEAKLAERRANPPRITGLLKPD